MADIHPSPAPRRTRPTNEHNKLRKLSVAASIAVTTSLGVLAAGAVPAQAAPGAQRFGYVHKTEYFCVPADVTAIDIAAVGGAGGTFRHTGRGGAGGLVTGTFTVVPNTELAITVGQSGRDSGGFGDGHGGEHGTSPGVSSAYSGAGGGGSTAVKGTGRACGAARVDDGPYLVVAGGGGGGGGDWSSNSKGGAGGAGGNPGGRGVNGDGVDDLIGVGGHGGCGGEHPGRGCNGSKNGEKGSDAGGTIVAGGGGGGAGGGYNGGGKGHGASVVGGDPGGGGGGGASYAVATGTNVEYSVGSGENTDGYVQLRWGGATAPGSGGSSDIVSGLFGSS